MKLSASIRRTEATQANVNNAISLLQTQDGVLKTADKVVSRMAELVQMGADVTKSTTDIALYKTEFQSLQSQLRSMLGEKFNNVSMFNSGGNDATITTTNTLSVVTSEAGGQSVAITQADLGAVAYYVGTSSGASLAGTSIDTVFGSATGAAAAVSSITAAIQNLATLRASNGSEQVRLTFAADMLAVNKTNLEAANGRIVDVDIASESANLARLNILQQAGTAMLAQANQANQSILRLLM
jgi:flagellin